MYYPSENHRTDKDNRIKCAFTIYLHFMLQLQLYHKISDKRPKREMVINLIEWASCLNSLRGYAVTAQYYANADYEEIIGNYKYENLFTIRFI